MVKVWSLVPSPSRSYSFDKIDEPLTTVGRTIDPDRGKKAAALQPGAFIAAGFPLTMTRALGRSRPSIADLKGVHARLRGLSTGVNALKAGYGSRAFSGALSG